MIISGIIFICSFSLFIKSILKEYNESDTSTSFEGRFLLFLCSFISGLFLLANYFESQKSYTCRDGVLYVKEDPESPFYEKLATCAELGNRFCKTITAQSSDNEYIIFKEENKIFKKSDYTDAEKDNAPIYFLDGYSEFEGDVIFKK